MKSFCIETRSCIFGRISGRNSGTSLLFFHSTAQVNLAIFPIPYANTVLFGMHAAGIKPQGPGLKPGPFRALVVEEYLSVTLRYDP